MALPSPLPDDGRASRAGARRSGLGAPDSWPPALRQAAALCTEAALPTALYWGRDRRVLRNEALDRLLAPFWGDDPLAPLVEPALDEVERTGRGLFVKEQPVALSRGGTPEETFWNCHLLPLRDEAGGLAGVLAQANEVTRTVLMERRLSFQISLADRLRGLGDPGDVKGAATELLGRYLGAARVGYAEIDSDGVATVQRDWTRDADVPSLAGQSTPISSFGEQALAFFRAGQLLAISDIRDLPMGSGERTAAWEAAGVRALITVPLVRDGELRALLYVHEPEPRAWRRADAALARDVAERTWAAVERAQAEQSLRNSEDHYRHTVELNPQVTWTARPDGQLDRVAGRWLEWTGTTGLGETWAQGLHPDDRPATFEAWAHSVATGEPYDVEHRVKRVGGSFRWARSRAFPRRDETGAVCQWYGSTEDIDERKVAEERQRLLVNELNHRVKNTLASVQAIAFQTLKGDIPLEEARSRFEARLMALSRTHNLLTEENWSGAALRRVVEDATEHLAGEGRRFDLDGDPLWLAPRAALALSLAFHELGTNAAKYGALSAEAGRVSIRWRLDGGRLLIEWRETGGPEVALPARRGFGSRLIERGLEADLGGRAEIFFHPAGLHCRIEAAAEAVTGGPGLG